MPDVDRISKLVEQLGKLSAENKLQWSETSDSSSFQCSFAKYSVTAFEEWSHVDWGKDYYNYGITIRDADGKILESARQTDFPPGMEIAGGLTPFNALKGLYDIARRRALKVDQALDDLLGSLGNLK